MPEDNTPSPATFALIQNHYREAFGATILRTYAHYRSVGDPGNPTAALGYTSAGAGPLFLERYLDAPAEAVVGARLGRPVARDRIVEIGHFATRHPFAMIDLWWDVAGALAPGAEVAIATLTRPLRDAMARIGVPLILLGTARPERAGDSGQDWGRYYAFDPMVCLGEIAGGRHAMARLQSRRPARYAA